MVGQGIMKQLHLKSIHIENHKRYQLKRKERFKPQKRFYFQITRTRVLDKYSNK